MKDAGFGKWFKRIFSIALMALVGGLIFNNALFMHIHLLPDGEIVVHAHPFNAEEKTTEPINQHEHSDSEYSFFDSLLLLFSADFSIPITKIHKTCERVLPLSSQFVVTSNGKVLAQRAPPCL